MELDALDRKILYQLDTDAQQTISNIARETNLSKEVTRYRIKKLEDTHIIQKYFAILNTAALNFTIFKVLVRLQNITSEKRKVFINRLIATPEVNWITSMDGEYNIGITFLIRDVISFQKILDEIFSDFHSLIGKRIMSINVSGEYLTRDYLITDDLVKRKRRAYSYMAPEERSERVNEKEEAILSKLCQSARMPISEIAEETGLTPKIVRYQIKKIRKRNILKYSNIILNTEAVGIIHYKVLFYLKQSTKKRFDEFYSYCHRLPNVVYIISCIGPWNVELDVEIDDIIKFRELINQITQEFTDIIQDYTQLYIYEIHKYSLYPDTTGIGTKD
ncbi:MAG: Lrp/AsnC family transcriptional regulator [Candidatus Altiarchaeota archaeon]